LVAADADAPPPKRFIRVPAARTWASTGGVTIFCVSKDNRLPPNVERAVADFARELRRRFGDEVLVVSVFGSYARGEANEDSDVDLFVVLENSDWNRRAEVIDLATDIGMPRDLLLSPTVFDRATWELWRSHERALVLDVEREGVPV